MDKIDMREEFQLVAWDIVETHFSHFLRYISVFTCPSLVKNEQAMIDVTKL